MVIVKEILDAYPGNFEISIYDWTRFDDYKTSIPLFRGKSLDVPFVLNGCNVLRIEPKPKKLLCLFIDPVSEAS